MKVGILTFHRADNYGAVLQTFALYNQCISMGYQTEVIDYRCGVIENAYPPIRFPQLRKNLYRWTEDLIDYLQFGHAWIEKKEKFDSFRKLFAMSPSYYDSSIKNEIEQAYDCIITGSDQIWSTDILRSPNYWYCYKKETASKMRVVSYAASVGSLPRFQDAFNIFEPVLNAYDAISVRETEVKEYLEGKLNRDVYLVLDPTLIVNKQLWLDLVKHNIEKKNKYLIYYDVAQNKLSCQIAKDIAKQNQYTIVKLSNIKSPIINTKYYSNAGPIDFLNSLYNAECIVTSSFHATIFSILFHKQFVAVLHPITGERIKTLLSALGLEDRIVYENINDANGIMNKPIDYDLVELKLSELKATSIDFLKNSLDF